MNVDEQMNVNCRSRLFNICPSSFLIWNLLCCATKDANLCQQVKMISEGFECVCVLQDGTQSDNIGLKDLYVSKAYNMHAESLQTL